MSYYQGDFYQGDPGFFSFLGGFAKKALGFIPGVGPVAQAATEGIGGLIKRGAGSRAGQMVSRAGAIVAKHPVISAAAGAGTIGALGAGVRGARMGKGTMARPAGAMGRKHRRMRVTNVRALRRAIRRCTGFSHLAKRVLRFTSPRPPRGRAVFKHRRRKRTV